MNRNWFEEQYMSSWRFEDRSVFKREELFALAEEGLITREQFGPLLRLEYGDEPTTRIRHNDTDFSTAGIMALKLEASRLLKRRAQSENDCSKNENTKQTDQPTV